MVQSSKMENEILLAQENFEKLNREIEKGAEKLKTAEEHCHTLEKSNQSLRLEAENLLQRIAMKDQALLEKTSIYLDKTIKRSIYLDVSVTTLQKKGKMDMQNLQNQSMMRLVLCTEAKPRLKWTPELHQLFSEAINQLGGAESEYH